MKASRIKKAKTAIFDNSRRDKQQSLEKALEDWEKKEQKFKRRKRIHVLKEEILEAEKLGQSNRLGQLYALLHKTESEESKTFVKYFDGKNFIQGLQLEDEEP